MINPNTQEILSLLLSVRYTYSNNATFDYSTEPRPCHNVAFMLEGEAVIETNGETLYVKPGDILFIPKNTTYTSHWMALPKVVFHSLHFSFHPRNDPLLNKQIPVQKLNCIHFDKLYSALKQIETYQFYKDERFFFALSSFYEICATLLGEMQAEPIKAVNKTISPALNYIEQNYTKPISVTKLASLCYLSPSRFHYLFKQQMGVSPIVYKNQLAIQHSARDLLYHADASIHEISEIHGFTSIIYFERLFKKIIGKSPSLYRKENKLL